MTEELVNTYVGRRPASEDPAPDVFYNEPVLQDTTEPSVDVTQEASQSVDEFTEMNPPIYPHAYLPKEEDVGEEESEDAIRGPASFEIEQFETVNSTGTLDEIPEDQLNKETQIENENKNNLFQKMMNFLIPSAQAQEIATPTPTPTATSTPTGTIIEKGSNLAKIMTHEKKFETTESVNEMAKLMDITATELVEKDLMEFIVSKEPVRKKNVPYDVKRMSIKLKDVEDYGVKDGNPFFKYDGNIYTKNKNISKDSFIDENLIEDITKFSKYQIKIDNKDIENLWKSSSYFSLKDQTKSINDVSKHLTQAARAQLYVILKYAKDNNLPIRISNFENILEKSETLVHPQGRGIDIGLNKDDEFEKWTGMKKVQQHYIKDNKKINHIFALNKILKDIFKITFKANMGALITSEAYRDTGDGIKFIKFKDSHIHTQTQHYERAPASMESLFVKQLFNEQNKLLDLRNTNDQ